MSAIPNPEDAPSFFDPLYTYHFSKYSCSKAFFFAHVTFNYLIMLAGIACFLTRIGPHRFKWAHRWFGRVYIICMLWSTATSVLIHNTGLPLAVLWSFCFVLVGVCAGWLLIVLHMEKMDKLALQSIQEEIAKTGQVEFDLHAKVHQAKAQIAGAKSFTERLFSYKAAHGLCMFTSWINITGRIFAANVSGDFTCHTYPVYKSLDTKHGAYANQTLATVVQNEDPLYSTLPWAKTGITGWALALSLGPLFGGLAIGAVFSYFGAKKSGATFKGGSATHSSGTANPFFSPFQRKRNEGSGTSSGALRET